MSLALIVILGRLRRGVVSVFDGALVGVNVFDNLTSARISGSRETYLVVLNGLIAALIVLLISARWAR